MGQNHSGQARRKKECSDHAAQKIYSSPVSRKLSFFVPAGCTCQRIMIGRVIGTLSIPASTGCACQRIILGKFIGNLSFPAPTCWARQRIIPGRFIVTFAVSEFRLQLTESLFFLLVRGLRLDSCLQAFHLPASFEIFLHFAPGRHSARKYCGGFFQFLPAAVSHCRESAPHLLPSRMEGLLFEKKPLFLLLRGCRLDPGLQQLQFPGQFLFFLCRPAFPLPASDQFSGEFLSRGRLPFQEPDFFRPPVKRARWTSGRQAVGCFRKAFPGRLICAHISRPL